MSGKRVRFRDLPEQKQRAVKRTAFAVAAFLAATGGLSLLVGGPLLRFIGDPAQFRAWVDAHGFWGRAAFVGMVFTQVVLAVLPGEPLEIAAGYAFGFWEGTLLCLVGISSASLLIFLFVRRFGMRAVRVFFSEEQIASVHFLHDRRRLTLLTLILFLIPGTPKDVMTYCVGLTEMKLSTWMAIATLARIPSIVTSTVGGNALGVQDYRIAVIVFAATAAVSIAGILAYRRLSARRAAHRADAAAKAPAAEPASGRPAAAEPSAPAAQVPSADRPAQDA